MDPVILSRLQFALTTIYHWLFVPLTLGLGWFVAFMQTRYYQTRDETWRKMSKFWGKLFLINFAIGVVTGIVQEFQFGMNWSEYSRYVGDIFGAPLAIEALLAFFLESTFLGIWIFGEGKVPEKVHLASIWLVAIGSNLSAIWILIANGFMQAPPAAAYTFNAANGRLELVNFFALIGNPKAWIFVWHTLSDGLAMAAFMILAVSAYHLAHKQNVDFFKRSFEIASVVGLVASVLIFLGGHTMGQYMRDVQPMKLASIEAIWETEQPASFSLLTIGDLSGKREVWSIRIPYAMSFLACNNFTCEVKGVNELQADAVQKYGPGDYIPLMVVTYWTFRIMMAFGFVMMGVCALFVWINLRSDITKFKWLKWVPWVLVLPYLANACGWILTEMGRQPWIVYGLLKVKDAVSPNLTPVDLLISLIGYTAVYGSLAVAMVYLMRKYAIAGPDAAMHESVDVAPALIGSQD
jgi:cytochrome bd ubiquinol oxidase subunit I